MKHLNIIIKPVERWFHYKKPFPINMLQGLVMYEDHNRNPVVCWRGYETYKFDHELF